jgi:hypothetical protein
MFKSCVIIYINCIDFTYELITYSSNWGSIKPVTSFYTKYLSCQIYTQITKFNCIIFFNNFLSIYKYVIITAIQWNLCNQTPVFSDILWHPTKIYGPKVFRLTKIKSEYSNILYNRKHFPGPLCQIWQVPLYKHLITLYLLCNINVCLSCFCCR